MRCVRCGYCCHEYAVMIVDDPDKGLAEGNVVPHGFDGPSRCKHLQGDKPGEYSCAVHDRPWYRDTPCYEHTQIEAEDSDCRMGRFMLDREAR